MLVGRLIGKVVCVLRIVAGHGGRLGTECQYFADNYRNPSTLNPQIMEGMLSY